MRDSAYCAMKGTVYSVFVFNEKNNITSTCIISTQGG